MKHHEYEGRTKRDKLGQVFAFLGYCTLCGIIIAAAAVVFILIFIVPWSTQCPANAASSNATKTPWENNPFSVKLIPKT